MFENIGEKIKSVAEIACWIGIIAFGIVGLNVMFSESFFAGLITIAIGFLVSWISAFTLYGFGQLIDDTSEIKKMLASEYKIAPKTTTTTTTALPKSGFAPNNLKKEAPENHWPD